MCQILALVIVVGGWALYNVRC
ncbi:MAG: photosystem II protein Y [Nitrososphaerota archaeon]|nr:photosystem II protein Y [Nitrososphaerota archaeon]MDG7039747.1 photosystem II protein Y [Nitrososphaerota archaeon]MDG7042810.1 photosystem II protein Y [Nitrososphaerota archaeon]MDG7045732.1 photosystem II protein Y [Nitrososphaerota archaeon]MDG7045984.1 photosystem II protein Y [Nitrososphaerota archaeon]